MRASSKSLRHLPCQPSTVEYCYLQFAMAGGFFFVEKKERVMS